MRKQLKKLGKSLWKKRTKNKPQEAQNEKRAVNTPPPEPTANNLLADQATKGAEQTIEAMPEEVPVPKWEVKLQENGLLDVTFSSAHPHAEKTLQNSKNSPLLALPAEIRNDIISRAVTDHHIHITSHPLPLPLDADGYPQGYLSAYENRTPWDKRPVSATPYQHRWPYTCPENFYNAVYPLEWRSFYRTNPVFETYGDIWAQKPDNREVLKSEETMTVLGRVCRQLYSEVGVLPYSSNEFSWETPYVMSHWLENRVPAQLEAMRVLWVDMEWKSSRPIFRSLYMDLNRVVFKVSRLALRTSFERFFRDYKGWKPTTTDEGYSLTIEEYEFKDWLSKRVLAERSQKWGELEWLEVEFVD